jgi:hypothetical protein
MATTVQYGFIGIRHLFSQRIQDVGVPILNGAVQATLAEYNRQLQAMMGPLVQTTERKAFRVRQYDGGGTLQPLDEWGNPLPVKMGRSVIYGLPLQRGGTAWGTNRESRALMTVEEANDHVAMAIGRDVDWMKRHVMAALFDNAGWTYEDDQNGGDPQDLNILGLANGDTETYMRRNGTNSTDNHYLGFATEIADATNPFGTIAAELTEHPENTGAVVHYIASDLVDDVEALGAFFPLSDPDLRYGADQTILPATGDMTGFNHPMVGFGDRVLGKVGQGWIVEWSSLPNHYIVSRTSGSGAIIGMREQPAAELKGFFPEFYNVDGNTWINRYLRIAGFGVINRVGAVVMEVNDATYDVPTDYNAPLAA